MKVIAPNRDYTGVSASVTFVGGVGETDNPHLIRWFKDHGYTVEDQPPFANLKQDAGNSGKEDVLGTELPTSMQEAQENGPKPKKKPAGKTKESTRKPKTDPKSRSEDSGKEDVPGTELPTGTQGTEDVDAMPEPEV